MSNKVTAAITKLQREISLATAHLTDEEYVEVMDDIESYCQTSAAAKREELERRSR